MKTRKIIYSLIFTLIAFPVSLRAQEIVTQEYATQVTEIQKPVMLPIVVSTHSFSASIIGIQYAYEGKIGQKATLIGRLEAVSDVDINNTTNINFNIRPSISIEPRFYYNIAGKIKKQKYTGWNSAEFLSLEAQYIGKSLASNYTMRENNGCFKLSPMWGTRRVNDHWMFELNVGVNLFMQADSKFDIGPKVNIKYGYCF